MQIYYFYEFNKKTIWTVASIIMAAVMITGIYLYVNTKPYVYPHELVAIDSLSDANTENAKAKLAKLSRKYNASDNEERWYYRFLTLKTSVKANEPQNNDKEIKVLLDHFEHPKYRNVLPQVYYCAGCVYKSLEDITISNQYFLKIIKEFNDKAHEGLLSLCYYQLGHNYILQSLHKEALQCHLKSLSYNKVHNLQRCIYDYQDLSWTMSCLGDQKASLEYMQKASDIAKQIKDTFDLPEIESQIAIHLLESGNAILAKKHIDKAMASCRDAYKSPVYTIAIMVYSTLGIDEKAKSYSDTVVNSGNIYGKSYANFWLTSYYLNQKDFKSANKYLIQYKIISDSVRTITAAESSAKANALYNYGLREKENLRLEKGSKQKTIYIIICVFTFIIGSFAYYIIITNIKHKKKQIEKRCTILNELIENEKEANEANIRAKEIEIEEIKRQLHTLKSQEDEKKSELERDLSTRQYNLEKLSYNTCQKKLCISNLKRTEIYKELKLLQEESQHHKFSQWQELEQTVYGSFPSFETELQNFSKMSDAELRVCLLIRVGFNSSDIGKYLCKSPNTIYSICKRLYFKNFGEKVAASKWEELILSLY